MLPLQHFLLLKGSTYGVSYNPGSATLCRKTIMKIVRLFWACFLMIGLTLIVLNYIGFCYRRGNVLSSDAYISAAIQNRLHSLDLRDRYETVVDFKADHPKCCRVGRFSGDNVSHFVLALLFHYQVTVEVKYPLLNGNGILEEYHAYVLVTKCGHASFDKGTGMRLDALPATNEGRLGAVKSINWVCA
jgi:hypothetical protein